MEVNEWAKENGLHDVIYLGDSVYAAKDEFGDIWLVTWNGYHDDPRNKIYLEQNTLRAFDMWRKKS